MNTTDIENLELDILLDSIYKRFSFDFRNYARSSLKRRIKQFAAKKKLTKLSELIPHILYDADFLSSLIFNISVTVTAMFRDPFVYRKIRDVVVPYLKALPHIKIWHAGCATGEEVYSMAILLQEEGLYDRCQIYATDFNEYALRKAKEGIYSIEKIKSYTANYHKAGGTESFSRYYLSKYDSVILDREIKRNIVFTLHNLTTDGMFGEMHMIFCRNVLIYFNEKLQHRVFKLFDDSLMPGGFIGLGTKESLRSSPFYNEYCEIAQREKIYQKKNPRADYQFLTGKQSSTA